MTSITAAQHTALLDALDALREKYLEACRRGDLKSEAYLDQQYRVVRDLLNAAVIYTAEAEAAVGALERQAIQEFIETSGFYLARELSEAACYRQSLGTPCGKQHPHIEVVYGVPEEIVAEYLTRKGASDE